MSNKFLIIILSLFICISIGSCGGDNEEGGKKAKKEKNADSDSQEGKAKDKKAKKKPSKPGIAVPAENDNEQAAEKISDKKWKLSKWQRSGKKTDKAPSFLWSFDENGGIAIAINKGKKLEGKWAFISAENKMYISLPGGNKKGSALNCFAEPFNVVTMSDSTMQLKNSQSELSFVAN